MAMLNNQMVPIFPFFLKRFSETSRPRSAVQHAMAVASQAQLSALDAAKASAMAAAFAVSRASPQLEGAKLVEAAKDGKIGAGKDGKYDENMMKYCCWMKLLVFGCFWMGRMGMDVGIWMGMDGNILFFFNCESL